MIVLWKNFAMVFSYLLSVYVERSCGIHVVDNGYRDIVIAIKPNTTYDEKLPEKIQAMMIEASSFLHQATKQRLYFSDVKILLPKSWPYNSSLVQRPTNQTYEKANVIIAEPNPLYGDTPYTLQYGGCGEKGLYIHLTPNFLLNDGLVEVYGKKGRTFVHEWAHLQWGVFNEYDDQEPFYRSSDGSIEATGCSKLIKGVIKGCSGGECSDCTNNKKAGFPGRNCTFYPEKNQDASSSIMYNQGLKNVEFCTDKTHNTEAPNMQNRMCDYRSTWDVISQSEDFRNISSPYTGSRNLTFTFLQAKDRVICLVLDVSASMNTGKRIVRLRQAAEIFLLQVIENGSQVGIVTFNDKANTIAQLKKIDDSSSARKDLVRLLPTSADGGTCICEGVRSGFQVLRGDDGYTSGDEIILLTDGEDDSISSCFTEVEKSRAMIHTIAFGSRAEKDLEQFSMKTGGQRLAATDKVDTNGLFDAFNELVSGDGNNQQAIQLESKGWSVDENSWFNDSIVVDKTVGNNTHFVFTWEASTPQVFVRDPNGKVYSNNDFVIEENVHTAWLKIEGTAQEGIWTYSIRNPGKQQQATVTVTSQSADENVPSITISTKITRKVPVVIYVKVSQGFLPVLNASVMITVEKPTGHTEQVELSDNGLGADIVSNDGVYSKYFLNTTEHGRYNFKVRAERKEGSTMMANRTEGSAMYIPGYTENGVIHINPPKPRVSKENSAAQIGSFSRVKSGGALSIPQGTPTVNFPPCKVTDLQATIEKDKIELQWTAPGADMDQGTASYYEMRMSAKLLQLRDSFSGAEQVNVTSLKPQPFGSTETFTIAIGSTELKNTTTFYFALCAYDENNQSSDMSNVASASFFVPLPDEWVSNVTTASFSVPLPDELEDNKVRVLHSTWITVVVAVIVCLIIGITYYIVEKKYKKRFPVAAITYRKFSC